MDAGNNKIIKDTVMKTLFGMFGNDTEDYCQLKKACIHYHHFFNIKDTEYINQFILYPVSDEAKRDFLKITDSPGAANPYIFINKINDKFESDHIYFTWSNSKEEKCRHFELISDKDASEFLKKLFNFINKRD